MEFLSMAIWSRSSHKRVEETEGREKHQSREIRHTEKSTPSHQHLSVSVQPINITVSSHGQRAHDAWHRSTNSGQRYASRAVLFLIQSSTTCWKMLGFWLCYISTAYFTAAVKPVTAQHLAGETLYRGHICTQAPSPFSMETQLSG
ncbi:hypothetical protein AOLI_G00188600 [Acnodon oligacanthus]